MATRTAARELDTGHALRWQAAVASAVLLAACSPTGAMPGALPSTCQPPTELRVVDAFVSARTPPDPKPVLSFFDEHASIVDVDRRLVSSFENVYAVLPPLDLFVPGRPRMNEFGEVTWTESVTQSEPSSPPSSLLFVDDLLSARLLHAQREAEAKSPPTPTPAIETSKYTRTLNAVVVQSRIKVLFVRKDGAPGAELQSTETESTIRIVMLVTLAALFGVLVLWRRSAGARAATVQRPRRVIEGLNNWRTDTRAARARCGLRR
jgi:hypothetical protein